MKIDSLKSVVPENSIPFIQKWLGGVNFVIHIKSKRKTKLGDYRFDTKTRIHHISVDGTLGVYPGFFVLTHEIAHLLVKQNHSNTLKSHGQEWKNTFGKLLMESIGVYPDELKPLIHRHAVRPKASVGADIQLCKKLFFNENQIGFMLENLPEGQQFKLGKRIFEKGRKRKIRYICKELKTNRSFLISGHAVVEEIFDK